MCESLARDLAANTRHVSAHLVLPGVVNTSFAKSSAVADKLLTGRKAPQRASGAAFAGDEGGKAFFAKMMSLGLLPAQVSERVVQQLRRVPPPFLIVVDNEPHAMDLKRVADARIGDLLAGRVPDVEAPPIVREAKL